MRLVRVARAVWVDADKVTHLTQYNAKRSGETRTLISFQPSSYVTVPGTPAQIALLFAEINREETY